MSRIIPRSLLTVRICALSVLIGLGLFSLYSFSNAQTAQEISRQIEQRNADIARLEQEIAGYQTQINTISREKRTLENEIAELEISRKSLNANIELTQSKIALAEETIAKLQAEIEEAEKKISLNKNAITSAIQLIQSHNDITLVETLLKHESLSEYWSNSDTLFTFQRAISQSVNDLKTIREELAEKNREQERLRQEEVALRNDLVARRGLVEQNKAEQSELLRQTQNKESEYQTVLADRKRLRDAFEAEIRDLESRLNLDVDSGAIPQARPNTLQWPVDNVIITQYFGNTAFATSNPQIYSGGGHNGIDLGIARGSNVRSAESGVITATGNTDLTCPRASYGKWVLVRHGNGLSTLYAHLDHIGVSQGQSVARGEIIGLSGNTGYSTGPHVHFEVSATSGIQISSVPSRGCPGANFTLPLVDPSARLNPLSYL